MFYIEQCFRASNIDELFSTIFRLKANAHLRVILKLFQSKGLFLHHENYVIRFDDSLFTFKNFNITQTHDIF